VRSTVWLSIVLALLWAVPAAAADDDDWGDESGWEELDQRTDKQDKALDQRPMALGTHTLPAGKFALRAAAGLAYFDAGLHAGVLDRLDLLADTFFPYTDLGNTFLVGGGAKLRIYGHGMWAYAFKLRAYGILYRSVNGEVKHLPEGLAVWPSFMIGMKIPQGCFYAEVGALIFPYTSVSSTQSYVFAGVPAHFGGEIYLTDWVHVYLNVDLVFSAFFGVFTMNLTGPFNGLEAGVLFIL
jgi:hypothetical protein